MMKRTRTRLWILSGLCLSFTALASAQRSGPSTARFEATGPAGFRIEGKTSDLKLEDDGTFLTVDVPLAQLDTGIGLRNKHMREKYLEVARYPDAVLKVAWAALKLPAQGSSVTAEATGKMTLHGTTREAPFSYVIHHTGATYDVTATTRVNLKAYGINVPSYMGLTVKPDLVTVVNFSATKS